MNLAEILSALLVQIADAEAAATKLAKENYDKGFADGVASVPVVPEDDKIFSQAELDQKIEEAVSPFRVEIEQVKAELESLKADVPQQIDAAVAAFKAELKAKYEAAQASESESEKVFGDLLA